MNAAALSKAKAAKQSKSPRTGPTSAELERGRMTHLPRNRPALATGSNRAYRRSPTEAYNQTIAKSMTPKQSKKTAAVDTDDDLFREQDASAESEEDLVGVTAKSLSSAVVWGTDWTAATIVDQLRRGTISLDPAFQRRDAWTNERKSRFIESLMLGLPIPQLVLAENQKLKGRFIVIDGKQRLLSLSKFTGVGLAEGQERLVLTGLKVRKDLNKLTYADISNQVKYESLISEFDNQAIRTVVIRGWASEEVLYTIFHRLNTGSVPLSTQELRQALHPGKFLSFAATFSEQSKSLKSLLGLTKPDFRMRDVELVVRFYAFYLRLAEYKGNLKKFLDDTCDDLNGAWGAQEQQIGEIAVQFEESLQAAMRIFSRANTFRKWDGERFEKPLNRAVFDVIAHSLADPKTRAAAMKEKDAVVSAFKQVSADESFRSAVESTTKSKEAVTVRFSKWYAALGGALGKKIPVQLPQ
jgi:hypothetical protein